MSFLTLSLYAQGYKPGDTATDFRLKNVNERMVSLADYKDANDVSEKYVEDVVEALLNKKPVKKAVTVAVGCGIKVKK